MTASDLTIVIPPVQGGVWDYAHALALALGGAARVIPVDEENATALEACMGKDVLLQYSGYGFAKRGAPSWLVRALRRRRTNFRSLGIYFHELFAFGAPTSSAFWLSPMQRQIAAALGRMSDYWLTSCDAYAAWLRRVAGDRPHRVLPVFSNVGECDVDETPRLPHVVVFGSQRVREATYLLGGSQLFWWARTAGLQIHDIGAPSNDRAVNTRLQHEGVHLHGQLDRHAVHALMQSASFGVIAYDKQPLAKSSVFSAYCAHGLCIIALANRQTPDDGLVEGVHFIRSPPVSSSLRRAQMGAAAKHWYEGHSLRAHAETTKFLLAHGDCATTTAGEMT